MEMLELTTGAACIILCLLLGCIYTSAANFAELFERACIYSGPLPLRFGSERVSKRFSFYDMRSLGYVSHTPSKAERYHITVILTFRRFGLAASSSRAIGSLFLRSRTEYGSCCLPARLVRKWSSAFCEITLVFPETNWTIYSCEHKLSTYQTTDGRVALFLVAPHPRPFEMLPPV